MPFVTISFEITNINFVWYDPETIYVQFDTLSFAADDKHNSVVLAALNEALGGRVAACDFTDDTVYNQAAINAELSLEQLQAFGWPVSDES